MACCECETYSWVDAEIEKKLLVAVGVRRDELSVVEAVALQLLHRVIVKAVMTVGVHQLREDFFYNQDSPNSSVSLRGDS